MAYTSSALSFLLPGFGKPVVVTGSQIPITRARSDGRQNLISALQAAVRLFPGFSASILANMCRPPLQGLFIEAHGAGNGASGDREFLSEIEAAVSQGIVVVVVMKAGAVPGFDMTTEAALTKLSVLLGQGLDARTVAELMGQNIAGELTRTGVSA